MLRELLHKLNGLFDTLLPLVNVSKGDIVSTSKTQLMFSVKKKHKKIKGRQSCCNTVIINQF